MSSAQISNKVAKNRISQGLTVLLGIAILTLSSCIGCMNAPAGVLFGAVAAGALMGFGGSSLAKWVGGGVFALEFAAALSWGNLMYLTPGALLLCVAAWKNRWLERRLNVELDHSPGGSLSTTSNDNFASTAPQDADEGIRSVSNVVPTTATGLGDPSQSTSRSTKTSIVQSVKTNLAVKFRLFIMGVVNMRNIKIVGGIAGAFLSIGAAVAVYKSVYRDTDQDGLIDRSDCAPNNSMIANTLADDDDCDGTVNPNDCKTGDASDSRNKQEDQDCDNRPDASDCDPNGHVLDADCDEVHDADDCAPTNQSNARRKSEDSDCDGLADVNDCGPTQVSVVLDKRSDRDCDGSSDAQDCDPDGHIADRDCDETPDAQDCAPDDKKNVRSKLGDGDCDGIPDEKDCAPSDAENNTIDCKFPFPASQIGVFTGAADSYKAYDAADNEIRRTNARLSRGRSISKALRGSRTFSNWRGKLTTIGTNSDGLGYVEVVCKPPTGVVGQEFTVMTWNNALSDWGDHTLISTQSKLYQSLVEISEGSEVVFSGTFLTSDASDFIKESSMTEMGSMMDPAFVARFSSVKTVP